MANSLVKTTFQAGPSDAMAAVDVYKSVSGTNIINRIQKLNVDASMLSGGGFGTDTLSNAQKLISELMGQTSNAISGSKNAMNQLLSSSLSAASKATSLLSGTASEITLNKEALMERLLEASSLVQSSLRRTDGNIMDAIMKDTPLRSKLLVAIGGMQTRINVADIRDINSIGRLFNDLVQSDIFTVKDNGALSGIMGTIIGTAAKLGIPNAFESLVATIQDNALVVQVIKTALPHVVGSSNMGEIWAIVNSPLGKIVNSVYPNLLPSLVGNYTWVPNLRGVRKNKYDFAGFLEISDATNRNWKVVTRSAKPTLDLSNLVGGSTGFGEMVETTVPSAPSNVRIYAIATKFSKLNTKAKMRRLFPRLALTSMDKLARANAGIVAINTI